MLYYGGGGQFGFQTVEVYSKRPKTERSVFRRRRKPNKFGFGFNLFEQTKPNAKSVRNFGQTARLGRFIYKDRHKKNSYLYKTV